jgi:transcriptional regulator with XRE-family HTH domain
VGDRAVKHVRKFLGQRLRALRKQRGLSQERLGERSSLSGKFIGEVERGEKSISIDSLYHVSVALEIPLRELTDVPQALSVLSESELPRREEPGMSETFVSYKVLQALFSRLRRRAAADCRHMAIPLSRGGHAQ